MKQQKIKHAIYCLAALGLVQFIMAGYSILTQANDGQTLLGNFLASGGAPKLNFYNATLAWPLILITTIVFVIKDLKEEKLWAYIAALTVFLISAPAITFPVSLFGFICLLDKRVRTDFIEKMDVAL